MSIRIPAQLEEQLRNLAEAEGRDLEALLEEAVRDYLDSVRITDLTPEQVGQTQMALMPELGELSTWNGEQERPDDAAR
jgi:hypothetical protein